MRKLILVPVLALLLMVSSLGVSTFSNVGVQKAEAHYYYTCAGTAIGGGGYIRVYEHHTGHRPRLIWVTWSEYVAKGCYYGWPY